MLVLLSETFHFNSSSLAQILVSSHRLLMVYLGSCLDSKRYELSFRSSLSVNVFNLVLGKLDFASKPNQYGPLSSYTRKDSFSLGAQLDVSISSV